MLYDLVIIGGGPAGVAAGVYAARKKIKTVLITDIFGGQSLVSNQIQNWIGAKSISGFDLGKSLEEHLKSQEGIEIVEGEKVTSVTEARDGELSVFEITTDGGRKINTKTVLVATGSRYKRLGIPGEDKFDGRGVAWCSTCDAPVFKGMDVAVMGGGNSGLEAVIDLLPYAKNIILFHRSAALKGDQITQERIRREEKVKIILNAEIKEILGEDSVSGVVYLDKNSGGTKNIPVGGVFIKIGQAPNTELFKELVDINEWGKIVIDHKTQRSSRIGIWVAGDASDVLYNQNNISAGDAVKAVLNIYEYLKRTNN